MKKTLKTESELENFAQEFAKKLKASDVIALQGDLGVGKTTFSRQLIRSLLNNQDIIVPSPTFNIVQIYEATQYSIYHYDLYRIKNIFELDELGFEEAFQDNITIIEWPEIILDQIKDHAYIIKFHVNEGGSRIIEVSQTPYRSIEQNHSK